MMLLLSALLFMWTDSLTPDARVTHVQASALSSSNNLDADGWPVLMEGDGGAAVHALQVALQKGGFFSGDDDMRWWSFSDSTAAALRFYQACAGLPESGVCDGRTWRALLGDGATPAALLDLRDEMGEYEDDLDDTHGGGRVWLLGEQRWERRQP